RRGLTYTRYADDVVISGHGELPEDAFSQVGDLIETAGWRLNRNKTRLEKKPGRLKVYGLLVNGEFPRLTKGYRKRVRAIRHRLSVGSVPHEELSRANGHLSYAKSIEKYGKK